MLYNQRRNDQFGGSHMSQTILIIEDEPDIVELLEYNLQKEGYRVLSANDGRAGVEMAKKHRPSLVLLDLMLPGMSGLDVSRELRADEDTKNIAVIMLTAKGEEGDMILGLELGADDYMTKPFSPKELLARMRAVLRRSVIAEQLIAEKPIATGCVTIDPSRFDVKVNGSSVPLTVAEFSLLHTLARHQGRVFTRNQLLDKMTGGDRFVIDRNVDVHIGAIRRKLGTEGSRIVTVRGVGYKFHDEA